MALASVSNAVQAPSGVSRGASMRARNQRSGRFTRDAKFDALANGNENQLMSLEQRKTRSMPGQIVSPLEQRMDVACPRGAASELPEPDLVAAAKKRDEIAFEELVERHKVRVYRHALRIMGNREDAEDVRQSSFQKAFLHLPEFQGKSSFSTWISRIAINEALMMRRKDRRGREVSIDEIISGDATPFAIELVDARPNPEHRYAQLESRKILNSALLALRPTMRSTLLFHGVEELSVEQTAEMLGVTANAAKSRISRGRKALREKIRKHMASANAV